jgi:hypothetical protein
MRSCTNLLVPLLATGLLIPVIGSRPAVDSVLAQSTQPRLVVFESFNSPG